MRRPPVSVIELPGYRRRADELLNSPEQDPIIDLIAYEPTCGDLIAGTGGLRKIRVGRGGSGKRGGAQDKKKFAALVKEITAQWQRK